MTKNSNRGDRLDETLLRIVTGIFSAQREREMLALRDNIGDDALQEQDVQEFILHMRAVYLQLLSGAFAKARGGLAAVTRNPAAFIESSQKLLSLIQAQPEFSKEIEAARKIYNSAYGSSATGGISAVSEKFSELLTGGRLSAVSKWHLTEHFASVWQNWILQLFPLVQDHEERARQSQTSLGERGLGCLMFLLSVIGISAIVAIIQLLR